jgi:hypothetical protein
MCYPEERMSGEMDKKRRIGTYHSHFLASILSKCFRPFNFSWITFLIKISMTFGTTKLEYFRIISHKGNSMPWIDGATAEITDSYSHFSPRQTNNFSLPHSKPVDLETK